MAKKIKLIRSGAKHSILIDEKVGRALLRTGRFHHADEKLQKPKRKAEVKDASSGAKANEEYKVEVKEAPPKKEVGPMTHGGSMTPSELRAMTFAELKVLAAKRGVTVNPGEAKEDLVGRVYRYLRRDMRAMR